MVRIALIEGLASYYVGRFLRKALYKDLVKLGFEVDVYPWTVKKIKTSDIIIAHSFGAGYAIKNRLPCKLLITLDARRWDFWNNSKLRSPIMGLRHINFYQNKGLRGYFISKAMNYGTSKTSHLKLPEYYKEDILERVNYYFGEKKGT